MSSGPEPEGTPSPERYFLPADDRRHVTAYSSGNAIELFTDGPKLFARILADLTGATGPDDFVYLANWWCDLDVPLGDPQSRPPSLRKVLQTLSQDKPVEISDASPEPEAERERRGGTQVCAILWQQKSQFDAAAMLRGLAVDTALPAPGQVAGLADVLLSLFGGSLLGKINAEAVGFINTLGSESAAILDNRTLAFGSHHQKILIVGSGKRLIAYCGSADFNADRLYEFRSPAAVNPPPNKGAPLSDVTFRIEGPAAMDLLKTFVERWTLHPSGKE